MNVLVVSANRYRNPMAVMPMGACLVADAAARAGHSVRLLDLMFSRDPLDDLQGALAANRPGAVGVSVRNIDNNDLSAPEALFGEIKPLVECARSRDGARVVLGGAAVGVMPEALLRETGADFAAVGDGETVFPRLLSAIEGGSGPAGVPGAAWLDNGQFRCNSAANGDAPFSALAGDCAPDYARWCDVAAYQRMMASAGVQTKRGCPFSCVYCTYGMAEGKEPRLFAPGAVVDACRRLARSGLRDIEFVDSIFNYPYEHAVQVCEALARARPALRGVRFVSLEMNPRFVDGPLLETMARAGFAGIGVTVDSAADAVLTGLGKGFTSGDVRACAAAVRRSRIPCVWVFLLGGPGETEATMRETLRFAEDQLRAGDVAFISIGLRVYPGTPLERIARGEGVLSAPPEAMLAPVFYVSPQVDVAWIQREVEALTARYLNALGPRSIRLPVLPLLYRIGRRLGIRPPLWRHTARTRRLLRCVGVQT